jgi:uncharacterized membrane protein
MTGLQALLSLHLICVVGAVGIGITNFINMRVAATQTGDIAKGLAMHRMATLPFGDIFIAGFVLTGVLMLWTIGGASGLNGWFQVKMVAVLVLLIGYGVLRYTIGQIKRTGNMALGARLKVIAPINLAAALVALVCAVLTFSA